MEVAGKFSIQQQVVYEKKEGFLFKKLNRYNYWESITDLGNEYSTLDEAYSDIQKLLKGTKSLPVQYHYFNS